MTLRFDERDGRVLEMLILPYGERVIQDDGEGAYTEEFIQGCFRDQIKEAQSRPLRIWLDIEHTKNTVIAHATKLKETDGGLYGSFAVHTGVTGDKVLRSVREGFTSVSATVTPLRTRTVDGVKRRTDARLVGVALVRNPAYPDAKVYSIRRAFRDDQPGPASTDEFDLWELERLEGKLRALQMQYLDEALQMQGERRRAFGDAGRSYTTDPRLQTVTNLQRNVAEQRAKLQAQLAPKTLRRLAPDPILVAS